MPAKTDEFLLAASMEGDHAAFAEIVKRYQVLVCSIAYSIVGDVAASEDVGQEAFLVAWRRMSEMRDPTKLKSWLATTTRNLARASLRGKSRTSSNASIELTESPAISTEETAMNREESDLVWATLEHLPETYREPLVLFYRQDRSVAEMANALDLSVATAKQRLSRGRAMLREEVLATVELSLRKSAPTAAFTIAAIGPLPSMTKTAIAGSGAFTAKSLGGSAYSGLAGAAVLGPLIGLAGALVGTWCSWATAEYTSQRKMIVRQTLLYFVGMLVFCSPFLAMKCGWAPYKEWGPARYGLTLAGWMMVAMVLNGFWIMTTIIGFRTLTEREIKNQTPRLNDKQRMRRSLDQWRGRHWTSKASMLGLPIVQLAFADPNFSASGAYRKQSGNGATGRAHAWIAIGDTARGRLLAVGTRAVAPIAVGVMSAGIFSFGVLSVGVVSFGVLSLAAIAYGAITLGVVASGGSIAAGVFAVAPMAFGVIAAKGPLAIAGQYAVGEVAICQAQPVDATAYVESSAAIRHAENAMYFMADLSQWYLALPVAVGISVLALLVGYQRSKR